MSIRASLQQVLHVAPPIGMQHATNPPDTATGSATLSATTRDKASADAGTYATHHATATQQPIESDATLAAEYQELTACIIELCQLAGYSDEVQERMLEARRNLYPFQYATECAYFREQVIRTRTGTYWHDDALRAGI